MSTESVPNPSAGASSLYRRIWRWHFFAGLFCLPFIFSLAVTGAIYLFHGQIDDVIYAPQMLRQVSSPDAPTQPPTRLVSAALHAYPGIPMAYSAPSDRRHNVQVDVIQADGGTLQVFVDPVTGVLAGAIDESDRVMTTVKHIHSLAIAGDLGKAVIEIVAGWIIVLISSGVYLWWPRGRRVGVVSIRPKAQGRTWWRDLHAVTGAFAAVVILFLALTGMPWSVFWGTNVNAWLTTHDLGVPKGMWSGVPQSALPASALGDLPWAQQQSAVPASDDPHAAHKAHGTHMHGASGYALLSHQGTVSLDAVIAQLSAIGMDRNYRLALPRDASGVYTAIRMPGQLAGQRVIHVDQYSNKVLMDIGADRIGAIARVTEWGVSVHQGGEYGTPNLLIMLAGCLALMALCISGITTWWKRRPAGKLAAPTRKDGDQLAKCVLVFAVVLGCCFPLLGASMLTVLLLDYLIEVVRRSAFLNSL